MRIGHLWSRRAHLLGLLLGMALLLPGCRFRFLGSTQPLIKIGLVAPFEGRLRARGYEVLYAVKLAVRQRNEAGGVGGFKVELVALDDGGDPAVAAQQVRELAVDRDVLGVVGHFAEEATQAAAPEYAAQGLALASPGVGAEGITVGGGVVRLGLPDRLLGREAARYAVESLAAKRLAVLRGRGDRHVDDARPSLADAFGAAIQDFGGTVVLDESIVENGWASRLAEASPDLVFLSSDAMEGGEVIRLARQAGVEATFFGGPSLGDRALVQVGGAATEGTVYLAMAPAGVDLAGGEAFVADYQALAGYSPGPRATLAYEATNLLFEAIARAAGQSSRQPSRAMVWQQLADGFQHEGLLGAWSVGSDGEPASWPVVVYRIEAGSYPGRRLR
jgi:branched-chain amino acid transport system substrate-binding protein